MNENNITRFEVSNFKKFDHLVVENIGQVNLITGDNNVGKTTLLEALLCNDNNTLWLTYLHKTLDIRNINLHFTNYYDKVPLFPNDNFLQFILKDINNKLEIKYLLKSGTEVQRSLQYKAFDKVENNEWGFRKDKIDFNNLPNWVAFDKNGIIDELQWLYYDDFLGKQQLKYWPYIPFVASYGEDLLNMLEFFEKYSASKFWTPKIKNEIINDLKILIPEIIDFELGYISNNKLIRIATDFNKLYQSLTTYGDGSQKFFRYIFTILYTNSSNGERLMIDEIDTGIHYTKMKEVWKAIFKLSNQTGVQIFATTHSLDCIKAFSEAAEESIGWSEKIRLIELSEANVKGKDKMYSNTYTKINIDTALDSNQNMLGGRIYGKY